MITPAVANLELLRASITVGEPVLDWVDIGGGFLSYRVKTANGHHVDIRKMMFNWRIHTVVVGDEFFFGRFWCYAGTGLSVFTAAVLAAAQWDGADKTEPEGWNKNGQTGEWREPGA